MVNYYNPIDRHESLVASGLTNNSSELLHLATSGMLYWNPLQVTGTGIYQEYIPDALSFINEEPRIINEVQTYLELLVDDEIEVPDPAIDFGD